LRPDATAPLTSDQPSARRPGCTCVSTCRLHARVAGPPRRRRPVRRSARAVASRPAARSRHPAASHPQRRARPVRCRPPRSPTAPARAPRSPTMGSSATSSSTPTRPCSPTGPSANASAPAPTKAAPTARRNPRRLPHRSLAGRRRRPRARRDRPRGAAQRRRKRHRLRRCHQPAGFPGAFIEEFEGRIQDTAYGSLLELIGRTRNKCPNAIILVFGYYAPLSYRSSSGSMKDFFQHEYGDDFGWWVNEHVHEFTDVDRMVLEAKVRSLWAGGRAQHWMRRAVTHANRDDAVRGPGILFVPSGMTPENSLFAREPLLHGDYCRHPLTAEGASCPPTTARRPSRPPRYRLPRGFHPR
jgi:hypothetical protein